jgi:hypothetical protein
MDDGTWQDLIPFEQKGSDYLLPALCSGAASASARVLLVLVRAHLLVAYCN